MVDDTAMTWFVVVASSKGRSRLGLAHNAVKNKCIPCEDTRQSCSAAVFFRWFLDACTEVDCCLYHCVVVVVVVVVLLKKCFCETIEVRFVKKSVSVKR